MKKIEISPMERLAQILKDEHLPQSVIDDVSLMGQETLERIAFKFENPGWGAMSLQQIPGIGTKRSLIIMAAIEEVLANMRHSVKAEAKISGPSYTCRVFEAAEVWRDCLDLIKEIKGYKFDKNEAPNARDAALAAKSELDKKLKDFKFTVRKKEGRTISLNKSMISEVCRIMYDTGVLTDKVIVIEHGVQDMLDFDVHLFDNDPDVGAGIKDTYQKEIQRKLLYGDVKVLNNDGTKSESYGFAASSAGHQKAEKGLCVRSDILKANTEFFWFGKTLSELATTTQMSGAEFWKARANLLRPLARPFLDENGDFIKVSDMLVVPDVKKVYAIKNGIKIGKLKGTMYTKGAYEEPVNMGDGAIIALIPMAFQGQCSGTGFKGFLVDGTSSIDEICRKHGMTLGDFLNCEVKGIDGKMHRIGDYKVICGEGCWKFDKAFSYPEYIEWLSHMEEKYPGIDRLYLLRQAEEVEEQEKRRTLTRTLIQQFMHMDMAEIRKLTWATRKSLKKAKSFSGQVKRRTAPWKADEEKTPLENLFAEAPWLVMNPVVMGEAESKWFSALTDALSCKFKTEGLYPYIMQDTVALLEVWVLGKKPDDPTIGVLRGDEVSVADIQDGEKVLCVRFPANFLTARVMTNRSMIGPFDSINGVMMISVHSLILIVQDGDVDGDEMGVYRNKLAIELTERMLKEFDPPVVLFAHGGKPPRYARKSVREFLYDCADALWRAKKFDSVGLYANLAAKCCYLATIAYKKGDTKKADMYLTWMAAASTGAIMALDQVKGNDVDLGLIAWLDQISESVKKAIRQVAMEQGYEWDVAKKVMHPYLHYWSAQAKNDPVKRITCLDPNDDNFLEVMSTYVEEDVGPWSDFKKEGAVWNEEAAKAALLYHIAPVSVKDGIMTQEMRELLGNNWYRFSAKPGESDSTAPIQKKLKVGSAIGFKDFLFLLQQNEMSMSYTMEGTTLADKRAEYIEVCRELIRMFLASGDWANKIAVYYPKGYNWTMEMRWKVALNNAVINALELEKVNDLVGKQKGQNAIFILKVFAPELIENVRNSKIGPEDFSISHGIVETVREDYLADKARNSLDLFDEPDQTANEQTEPEYIEEPVTYDEAAFEEWAATISDDYVGEPPAEGEEGYFSGDFE